jgi:hypothetical protein
MHDATVGAGEADRAHLAEFILQICLGVVRDRLGADQRAPRGDEREFERFDFGEAPGRVARRRPDDIGDPVARLIEQLRRLAAELHRGEDIDTDAPAGIRLDLARPRRQEPIVHARD